MAVLWNLRTIFLFCAGYLEQKKRFYLILMVVSLNCRILKYFWGIWFILGVCKMG